MMRTQCCPLLREEVIVIQTPHQCQYPVVLATPQLQSFSASRSAVIKFCGQRRQSMLSSHQLSHTNASKPNAEHKTSQAGVPPPLFLPRLNAIPQQRCEACGVRIFLPPLRFFVRLPRCISTVFQWAGDISARKLHIRDKHNQQYRYSSSYRLHFCICGRRWQTLLKTSMASWIPSVCSLTFL